MKPTAAQSVVCDRAGAIADTPAPDSRLGIALNAREPDLWPLNGLRHPAAKGTNGWYIWRGERLSIDDDFFEALHTEHLPEWCDEAVRFLALPPGWRFLLAPGQEDVWHDATLLNP